MYAYHEASPLRSAGSMSGPTRLYRLLIDLIQDHVRWQVRCTQVRLMAKLRCTLRTLQRWTAILRDKGCIETRQSIDGRGYRSTNIYVLLVPPADDDHGGPVVKNYVGLDVDFSPPAGFDVRDQDFVLDAKHTVCPDLSETYTNTLSEEKVTSMSRRASAPTTGQLGFDFGADDPVDNCLSEVDTDSKCPAKAPAKKKGYTDTQRVMAYWLAGRAVAPTTGARLSMGKVIKRCFEHGLSERDVRDAIDDLMHRGTDWWPSHLSAYLELPRSAHRRKRNYDEKPLRKTQPQRSTLSPQRVSELEDKSRRIRESRQQSPISCPVGLVTSPSTPAPNSLTTPACGAEELEKARAKALANIPAEDYWLFKNAQTEAEARERERPKSQSASEMVAEMRLMFGL